MPALDFKEIPEAHIASGQQDKWEQFAEEFLSRLGFRVVNGPSRGNDEGKDLIVAGPDPENPDKELRWLVSCKHKAHTGKTVGRNAEEDIPGRVVEHNCEGFIGFYSTLTSSGLDKKINSYSSRFRVRVIHDEHIEAELLRKDGDLTLAKRYFPESFQKWEHQQPRPVAYAFGDIQRASNLPDSPYMIETRMLGSGVFILPRLKDGVDKPEYELKFDLGISIHDEDKEGTRYQEFSQAMETGNVFWLNPGEYHIKNVSAELQPFLTDEAGERGRFGMKFLERCMDIAVMIEDDEGDLDTIEGIRVRRVTDSDELLEFTNAESNYPLVVTLVYNHKEGSISFSLEFRNRGASIHDVYKTSKFRKSLAKGGTVTIEAGDGSKTSVTPDAYITELSDKRVTLVKGEFLAQEDRAPTERLMKFLHALLYIERKIERSFVFPERDIDSDDFATIMKIATIMKKGKLISHSTTQGKAPLSQEAAIEFVQSYKPGAICTCRVDHPEVIAKIFDADISLGSSTQIYYRVRVEDADVEELKRKLDAGEDEELYLAFTSIEGEPIVEEYPQWLPNNSMQ